MCETTHVHLYGLLSRACASNKNPYTSRVRNQSGFDRVSFGTVTGFSAGRVTLVGVGANHSAGGAFICDVSPSVSNVQPGGKARILSTVGLY